MLYFSWRIVYPVSGKCLKGMLFMTLDMTRGKPTRLLIIFAMPLILSSLLQQLYTMCDSVIVGRLLGTDAFAAVGSASYLNWFTLSMIIGASNGFGVALSQRFGAHDQEGYRRFFAAAFVLMIVIGALISTFGVVFLKNLLATLNTPPELLGHAVRYVRVLWSGLLLTALLNMLTAALRAAGDSRTPFISLVVSTVLNIALDFLLLGWFGMGVEGAALATVLSEGAAAAWCLLQILRLKLWPGKGMWRLRLQEIRELLRLGIPPLLSQGVIATGELAVLAAINSFGVVYVTGTTAARRYFSLFNVVGTGLEGALATFTGQNWGAGQKLRIVQGTRAAVTMGATSSVIIAVAIMLTAKWLIGVFIPASSAEALRIGTEALCAEVLFLPALYLLCEYRASIQGMGNAVLPMLSGFLELALRLIAAWLLPIIAGSVGLYFTDAVTWTVTAVMLAVSYYVLRRKHLMT